MPMHYAPPRATVVKTQKSSKVKQSLKEDSTRATRIRNMKVKTMTAKNQENKQNATTRKSRISNTIQYDSQDKDKKRDRLRYDSQG